MRKYMHEFFRRGMIACGFGPLILAILYLILHHQGLLEMLTVSQVCIGIFSISALAFIAGGMNSIYQFEQLPLMLAIFIHGIVLYFSYLATYLINGWLKWGKAPFLVFTGIFVLGYLAIWGIIYFIIKQRTASLNVMLQKKQQALENQQ